MTNRVWIRYVLASPIFCVLTLYGLLMRKRGPWPLWIRFCERLER